MVPTVQQQLDLGLLHVDLDLPVDLHVVSIDLQHNERNYLDLELL